MIIILEIIFWIFGIFFLVGLLYNALDQFFWLSNRPKRRANK